MDNAYAEQQQEIEAMRCKLSHTMDKQQRKQLLQLVDAESQLHESFDERREQRRPSGDGMVRKRENGRWEDCIVIGHKANGGSIFLYIYANTKKELTDKFRQNIDTYQGIDLTEQSRMTLSEMAITPRPSILEHYRKDLTNHVKPYLGAKLLTQATASDLRKLYDALKQNGRVPPASAKPVVSPAILYTASTPPFITHSRLPTITD